jgi:putative cardiolipin synthase
MHSGKRRASIGKEIHLLIGMAMVFMVGCAALPENVERPVSHAYTDTEDTLLGKARRLEVAAHPDQSGFLLLTSGGAGNGSMV